MAVIGGKTDFTADVFDFFDTPRNEDNRIQESTKPRKATGNSGKEPQKPPKHDAFLAQKSKARSSRRSHSDSDSSHSSDSDVSDIETDSVASYKSADRVKNNRSSPGVVVKGETYSDDSFTDSSSAYSDESTDDEEDIIETERERFRQKNESKESKSNRPSDLQVHKTPVHEAESSKREAWSTGGIRKVEIHQPRSDMEDQGDSGTSVPNRSRPKSSKPRSRGINTSNERLFRERSKSGSDSEMTDVSPLPSPKHSPRSHNGHVNVQYDDVPNIKLQNKQLDLSVLMDAVQEIEREQQRNERLKINSRRVMFAPPKGKQTSEHGNFTYDQDRAKTIEKENQRLLKEIMKHVGPNKKKQHQRVAAEPFVQRLTPSAVNRKRDQRRIESENLQMLRRLQTTNSTRGMSRNEQLNDYKRTVLYGVPMAAVQPYEGSMGQRTRSLTSVFSSTTNSTMRSRKSRPGSAKSTTSTLRPGSAKSIGSLRPGSAKSVRSMCSTNRLGSAKSVDNRPVWNDRFCYS
ncbi:cilia- and flagella-associated protein 97-like [Pecten maximus]|uniref:cilia- and flagella-associated protein 97-like n=1 Tax=Pecten maximus TaxID=6579 RepID=UPI0014585667|nr:cilia- and flagella-associated protein 97-like [Pecten maximus]